MGIIAIADWGRRYLDKGLRYPIPTFPPYLFMPLPESHQEGAQVPVKPSHLGGPGGDVRHRCWESWKWLVTVLQFLMDEATVANGAVYGGRVRPASVKRFFPPVKGLFVGVCVKLLRRMYLSMYWEFFTHLQLMRGWNR